jgi:hypothetical protein
VAAGRASNLAGSARRESTMSRSFALSKTDSSAGLLADLIAAGTFGGAPAVFNQMLVAAGGSVVVAADESAAAWHRLWPIWGRHTPRLRGKRKDSQWRPAGTSGPAPRTVRAATAFGRHLRSLRTVDCRASKPVIRTPPPIVRLTIDPPCALVKDALPTLTPARWTYRRGARPRWTVPRWGTRRWLLRPPASHRRTAGR